MQGHISNDLENPGVSQRHKTSDPIIWDESSHFKWKELQAKYIKNRICNGGSQEINCWNF
jgi:hypothetical protein